MQTKSQNNNIAALGIGIFLIILIAIVTILRPIFSKNNSSSTNAKQQDVAMENLKKAPQISDVDLAKKIQARDNLSLLDIRLPDAYANEHILNSQNVSLADINGVLTQLDKNKTFVIIDDNDISDQIAMVISSLSDSGFNNIFYLTGGFSAWKGAYNPTISAGNPDSFTDQSKISYIQTDKLKDMMNTETNLVIIDVRKNTQFNDGHLKNAINIFLDDLEKRKKDIPIGKKIVLYDNDGLGAFKAGVRLFDMGFFNTFTLSDGLDAWKKKNYELVK
jgi:hydroxyacylglutathione hydrolase